MFTIWKYNYYYFDYINDYNDKFEKPLCDTNKIINLSKELLYFSDNVDIFVGILKNINDNVNIDVTIKEFLNKFDINIRKY